MHLIWPWWAVDGDCARDVFLQHLYLLQWWNIVSFSLPIFCLNGVGRICIDIILASLTANTSSSSCFIQYLGLLSYYVVALLEWEALVRTNTETSFDQIWWTSLILHLFILRELALDLGCFLHNVASSDRTLHQSSIRNRSRFQSISTLL